MRWTAEDEMSVNSRLSNEILALCGKNRDRIYLENIAKKLLKNAKNMKKSSGLAEEAERLRKTAEAVLRIAVDCGR